MSEPLYTLLTFLILAPTIATAILAVMWLFGRNRGS